jgi:hypothetical protein
MRIAGCFYQPMQQKISFPVGVASSHDHRGKMPLPQK